MKTRIHWLAALCLPLLAATASAQCCRARNGRGPECPQRAAAAPSVAAPRAAIPAPHRLRVRASLPAPVAANPEATFVDRLQAAYAKELAARDYYLAAAAAFPRPRRFANLARAEQRHAEAIAVAIEGLGAKPAPREPVRIDAPRSVVQADAAGRRIEVEVIALYKDLLRDCKDPGVRTILDHIQAANLRHLEAFGG